MQTRQEIERVLHEELNRARTAHEQAKEAFGALISDIPSGLPSPDGSARIASAGKINISKLEDYAQAIREFNDFVLHGVVPERLKEPAIAAGTQT